MCTASLEQHRLATHLLQVAVILSGLGRGRLLGLTKWEAVREVRVILARAQLL